MNGKGDLGFPSLLPLDLARGSECVAIPKPSLCLVPRDHSPPGVIKKSVKGDQVLLNGKWKKIREKSIFLRGEAMEIRCGEVEIRKGRTCMCTCKNTERDKHILRNKNSFP